MPPTTAPAMADLEGVEAETVAAAVVVEEAEAEVVVVRVVGRLVVIEEVEVERLVERAEELVEETVEELGEELMEVAFDDLLLVVSEEDHDEVRDVGERCVDDSEELMGECVDKIEEVVLGVDIDENGDGVDVGIFVVGLLVLKDRTTLVVGVTEYEVTGVEKLDDSVIPDPDEVVALAARTDDSGRVVIPEETADGKVVRPDESSEVKEAKKPALGNDVGIEITPEEIAVEMSEKAVFICTVENPELNGNEFDVWAPLPADDKDSRDDSGILVVLAGISDVLRTVGAVASEPVGRLLAAFDEGTCVKESVLEGCNRDSTMEAIIDTSLAGTSIVIGEGEGWVVASKLDGRGPDGGLPLADDSTAVGSGIMTMGVKS